MTVLQGEVFSQPRGVAAILDTSVFVRAWLSPTANPNAARRVMLLAGAAYDAFVSPSVLEETERVLARPDFGFPPHRTRVWIDGFVRYSRQTFPDLIPGESAEAVGGDVGDVPILKTAYATNVGGEFTQVLEAARRDSGCFIVSENTRHFVPGRNVYGWELVTAAVFLRLLVRRGRRPS